MKTKKKVKKLAHLSDYQRSIRNHIIFIDNKKRPNFSVSAGPGSGKSYTLGVCIDAITEFHPDSTILAIQFNKHIKLALEAKFKGYDNLTIKTVSSAGYAVLTHNKIKCRGQVDKNKYWGLSNAFTEIHADTIIAELGGTDKWSDPDEAKQKRKSKLNKATSQLTEVARMAMNTLTDFTSIEKLAEMCNEYCVEYSCPIILTLVKDVIEAGLEATKAGKWGFEDMTFYPVHMNLRFPQYDFVLADEGQDFNACALEIVSRFAMRKGKFTGRIGSFSDRNQSIMGWAGAMSNSVDEYVKKVNARVLPLSICYRCPSSHLDLARLLVPEVENRPDCPVGEVIPFSQEQIPEVVKPGDFILCRTTAPLVKQCINLIKHRIPAQVKGREIAGKLLNVFDECIQLTEPKPTHIDTFIGAFKTYCEEEISRAMVKKISASRMELMEDTFACLQAIASYLSEDAKKERRFIAPEAIKAEVNRLFAEDVPGSKVMLSTVHKAKGLEADNIFIIEFDKMPTVRKNETPTEDQIKQERNVKYVALTRGKDKMYICGVGNSMDAIREQVLK